MIIKWHREGRARWQDPTWTPTSGPRMLRIPAREHTYVRTDDVGDLRVYIDDDDDAELSIDRGMVIVRRIPPPEYHRRPIPPSEQSMLAEELERVARVLDRRTASKAEAVRDLRLTARRLRTDRYPW